VETELAPEEYLKKSPSLHPEDIAAGVLYVLGAPPHVQVCVVCDVRFYSSFPRVISLTPWSRFSLGKLTFAKMVKFHYHAHNSPPPVPNHSEIYPVYAFNPNILGSAIFKYTRGSSNFFLPADFPTKPILSFYIRPH